jgi:hypothetical protein
MCAAKYAYAMAADSVLDEIQNNTKAARQRPRVSLNLTHSQGMTNTEDYGELVTRLRTALAVTEAAYLEARKGRGEM